MNKRELLIHRWCQRHRGRNKKGKYKERQRKWQEVKHLAKEVGIKIINRRKI